MESNHNPRNFVVLGQSGAGKSSLINLLYCMSKGYTIFNIKDTLIKVQGIDCISLENTEESTSDKSKSQTLFPKLYEIVTDKGKINILDTPGFCDAAGDLMYDNFNLVRIQQELIKQFKVIHGFLIVLHRTDLTNIDAFVNYTFIRIKNLIPDVYRNNILFLVTHTDEISDKAKKTINTNLINVPNEKICSIDNIMFINPSNPNDRNRLIEDFEFLVEDYKNIYDCLLDEDFFQAIDLSVLDTVGNHRIEIVTCIQNIQYNYLEQKRLMKKLVEINRDLEKNLMDFNIDDLQNEVELKQFKLIKTGYLNTICIRCNETCHENCEDLPNEGVKAIGAKEIGKCTSFHKNDLDTIFSKTLAYEMVSAFIGGKEFMANDLDTLTKEEMDNCNTLKEDCEVCKCKYNTHIQSNNKFEYNPRLALVFLGEELLTNSNIKSRNSKIIDKINSFLKDIYDFQVDLKKQINFFADQIAKYITDFDIKKEFIFTEKVVNERINRLKDFEKVEIDLNFYEEYNKINLSE